MRVLFAIFVLTCLLFVASCGDDNGTESQAPVITSLTTTSADIGASGQTTINGTHLSGATTVSLGDGIGVTTTSATDTAITVNFQVFGNSASGARTVTVITAQGTGQLVNGFTVNNNHVPVAHMHIRPATGSVGMEFTFDGGPSTDQGTSSVSHYHWAFCDNTTRNGQVVKHTFDHAGTCQITLTVTDDHGATASVSRNLEISANRPPVARFTATPEKTDTATPVAFDATTSSDPDGHIAKYLWDFGDGSNKRTGSTVEHKYVEGGKHFTVTLTVTDDGGATATATKTVEISKSKFPIARFAADPVTTDINTPVEFDASASEDPDGRIVKYSWDFGDNTPKKGNVKTEHQYTKMGTYTVTLTVTDNFNQSASDSKHITVADAPEEVECKSPYHGGRIGIFGYVIGLEGNDIIFKADQAGRTCANSFLKCGDISDVRETRRWGTICKMWYRGNSTFRVHVVQAKSKPAPGDRGFLKSQDCSGHYCN